MGHQLAGQGGEQLGVRVFGAVVPVVDRLDQAGPQVTLPEPVDDHRGEPPVRRATVISSAPAGRAGPRRAGRGRRAARSGRSSVRFQCGLDRLARLQRDRDRRHAPARLAAGRCSSPGPPAACPRAAGEAEEVGLVVGVERGVVAAGTLHLGGEERLGQDLRLGRHRGVVLRGHPEPGGAAAEGAPLHPDQLGHEPVDRRVVGEGVVEVAAERAGVVQGRLEDAGVLGQDVLPVAHPAVGPARVGEPGVDGPVALVGRRVGQERLDLGRVGDHADRVERQPAEERRVVGRRAGLVPQAPVDEVPRAGRDVRGGRPRPAGGPGRGARPVGVVGGGGLAAAVGVEGVQPGRFPVDERLPAWLGQGHVAADQPRDVARRDDGRQEFARLVAQPLAADDGPEFDPVLGPVAGPGRRSVPGRPAGGGCQPGSSGACSGGTGSCPDEFRVIGSSRPRPCRRRAAGPRAASGASGGKARGRSSRRPTRGGRSDRCGRPRRPLRRTSSAGGPGPGPAPRTIPRPSRSAEARPISRPTPRRPPP